MNMRPNRYRSHKSPESQKNTCNTQWLIQQMRKMSHELNVQKNIFDHEIQRICRRSLTDCDRHLFRFLSSRHENFQTIESRLSLILNRLKKRLALLRSKNTRERLESSSRRSLSVTDTERREVKIVYRQEGEEIRRKSDQTELNEDQGQMAIPGTSKEDQRSYSHQEIIGSESTATNRSRTPSRVSMDNNFRLEETEHPQENSTRGESHIKKSVKELEKTTTAIQSSRSRSRDRSHSIEQPRLRTEEYEQTRNDNRQRSLRVSVPSYRSYQGRSRNLSNGRQERFIERERNWSTERDRPSVRSSSDHYNRQYNVIFVPVNYEENYPFHWNPGYDLNYNPPPLYGPETWYPSHYMRGIMPRGSRGGNRRFHRSSSQTF
ncbi:uncharacterized protein LOC107266233 isoform X2 [Cephus cinctus]|uniref:Uncharacterized protein LOC107266233 isoform X2 n=1 Tax=Cephus cinctus TaxID=211228 RepID=A0AAJ7BR90_CEPCN|nr:uncharacterized protein LOC107266233 isoform X2 [Cephus cinctus]